MSMKTEILFEALLKRNCGPHGSMSKLRSASARRIAILCAATGLFGRQTACCRSPPAGPPPACIGSVCRHNTGWIAARSPLRLASSDDGRKTPGRA